MAQLLVRNLRDDVKERLKRRAKRHGRSLEAEAREVIEAAVEETSDRDREASPKGFGTLMREHFGKRGLTPEEARSFNKAVDELRRGSKPRDPGFGE